MGFTSEKYYGRQKAHKVIPFVQKSKIFYIISALVIIAGFVGMGVNQSNGKGILNYSLDFTGGTSMTVPFEENINVTGDDGAELLAVITDAIGTGDVQLQNVQGSNDIVIKTQVLDKEARETLKDTLVEQYGVDESQIEEQSISAVVSDEMKQDAIIAVVIATICMLIYIWLRFKDIKFGASAVIALMHDVLCVLTVYTLVRIPVGNTFIACMLTIVGYSINATIVIFDRIRENRQVMYRESLEEIVNASITQTLSRSINTSLTTFISVFVLYILGVASIREFALPLIAGIIVGAWSSIFITGTLWYMMSKHTKKN
jgi:SecD/SecF fusion protein